jgi:enoyl-CoA hydratase
VTYETVLYRKPRADVAEIRFNRPQRLNAVIEALYRDTLASLDAAEADAEIRAVLLTGEGRAFCVGADYQEHARGTRTPAERRDYLRLGQDVCRRIHTLRKPVIAAVNGFALGAGAEMAVAADFILMADSAEIGFPEARLATFIGGGVTTLLPRLVGLAKARELVMLGLRLKGPEAAAIGLASRCFPAERFAEEALAFAELLAGSAPLSVALAKEQLNAGGERDYDTALLVELEGVVACTLTEDWQEGVRAFAEKRAPVFRGR